MSGKLQMDRMAPRSSAQIQHGAGRARDRRSLPRGPRVVLDEEVPGLQIGGP